MNHSIAAGREGERSSAERRSEVAPKSALTAHAHSPPRSPVQPDNARKQLGDDDDAQSAAYADVAGRRWERGRPGEVRSTACRGCETMQPRNAPTARMRQRNSHRAVCGISFSAP
eukprot:scaffold20210_cov113-Isochrysis_galbana.AAC.2